MQNMLSELDSKMNEPSPIHFIGLLRDVSKRIGRPVEPEEVAAVAVVVGYDLNAQKPGASVTPSLSDSFQVNPEDSSAEVAWRINDKVRRVRDKELLRREQAGENVLAIRLTNRMVDRADEAVYRSGGVCSLGSLPKEWVHPVLRPFVEVAMRR